MTDNDYHKYFIVDGRHVGDYEGMYKNCPDPWQIEELGLRLDMRAALLLVDQLPTKPLMALDAGAGAGLLSAELLVLLSQTRPGSHLTLSDISETALGLAKKRILGEPGLALGSTQVTFTPFDLRSIGEPSCPWPEGSFDLIFLAQVLWGLAESLDGLFPGLKSKLKPDGYLVMSQHFPGPGRQRYAPCLDPPMVSGLASRAGLNLRHTLETDRTENHHWAALWSCA
ncbi:MAG: class I SAM-dependent methyltransferase [Deltaproteobacteria bacterium]|jgi:SAM-dependent methyltransferase|nr:class I SAM-dependent methyltransferase [Deltaproteobacteria bacterium]